MRVSSLQRWQVRAVVYAFIAVAGLTLLFFARPNRLTHDQIDRKLVVMAEAQPNPFSEDYLLGSPKRVLVNNHFAFQFFAWMGRLFGSDELGHWALMPVVFTIFTIGFFELTYAITGKILVSLAVAVAANLHQHVFTAEWGLPGPSNLDPWVFAQALVPYLFLAFYRATGESRAGPMLFVFAGAGLLGNIHILTAFNFIGVAALTYLIRQGVRWQTVATVAAGVALAVLVSAPFLATHYQPDLTHLTNFDPANDEQRAAVLAIAHHVTPAGLWRSLTYWLGERWWTIWPLVAAMVWVRSQHRRQGGLTSFDRFGFAFIIGTVAFNLGFALLQLARLSILHQLPFWNQPRGVQYVYLVLFPYAGLALAMLWGRLRPWLTPARRLAGACALAIAALALGWRAWPWLQARYQWHVAAPYSYRTCDSDIYRFFETAGLPAGPVLHDPDAWSAMRICTRRAVVVQGRDRGFAYSLGSDTMLEWYRRYQAANRAYRQGGAALLEVARRFGARIVVSRQCLALPAAAASRQTKISQEGCVYVLKEIQT